MMNTDALRRKIDRMIAVIDEQSPRQDVYEDFDYTVFTPDEAEKFVAMLVNMRLDTPHTATHRFSDGELEELRHWLELYKALQSGDQARAAYIRRRLSTPVEQLIEMFLSLDLDRLPPDGISIVEGHCIYHLSRANYRYRVINNIRWYRENGRLDSFVRDDLWRWVLRFEQLDDEPYQDAS